MVEMNLYGGYSRLLGLKRTEGFIWLILITARTIGKNDYRFLLLIK